MADTETVADALFVRGLPKGGFQKGGFGGCSPGTKTGTRVHSDVPPERTPERGYIPMFLRNEKPVRGHVRQNHPFTKPSFCFLSICGRCFRDFYFSNQEWPRTIKFCMSALCTKSNMQDSMWHAAQNHPCRRLLSSIRVPHHPPPHSSSPSWLAWAEIPNQVKLCKSPTSLREEGGNTITQEWTNFVRERGFNLNSSTLSREKPPDSGEIRFSKPFRPWRKIIRKQFLECNSYVFATTFICKQFMLCNLYVVPEQWLQCELCDYAK